MISNEVVGIWDRGSEKIGLPNKKIKPDYTSNSKSRYTGLHQILIEEESLAQLGPALLYYVRVNEMSIQYKNEGQKDDFLNSKLSHIGKAIDNSKYILELKEDWDDEGASATNLPTYCRAINFVRRYALKIFEWRIRISAPKIDILKDGSIGVNWETVKASFLIIFDVYNEKVSYCYGKNKENGIPFKTGIENDNTVDESVATWMKNHLKA